MYIYLHHPNGNAAMGRLEIKESRRVQLIEATIDALARHGFAEFTLAQVADAAGLSQGIVNFYFHSKEALLVETLKFMEAEYEQFWTTAVRRAGPRPVDKLAAMIAADFDPVMTSRKKVTVWYAFWGEARWRPEYLKICQSLSESYFAETRALCREIVETGGLYEYRSRFRRPRPERDDRRSLARHFDEPEGHRPQGSQAHLLRSSGRRLPARIREPSRCRPAA